ncbi:MAG: DUF2975 domain-containing protein [Tannerella sp.]|jgi:hypothetical protein|nr:DUF2975 domain-containing protein [Tannerella sp.]
MKRVATLFLKVVILLVAMTALLYMAWAPQTEGRAANLDIISIYTDPFIIYCYIASIPFFMALYQAFKFLGYVDSNKAFAPSAVKAVRNIKYGAITLSGLIISGIIYIRLSANGDDPTGVTVLGIITAFASIVIAAGTTVFERLLYKKNSAIIP